MTTKPRGWSLPLPVLVLPFLFLCATVATVAYFLAVSANRANEDAVRMSRHLAQTAFASIARETADRARDYAWWDETLDQVTKGIDPGWGEDNIGKYLLDTFDISGTLMLDPARNTIFFSRKDDGSPGDAQALLGAQLGTFLDRVQHSDMERSDAFTIFTVAGNRAYLVAAAPVTAEHPEGDALKPHPRPVLILYKTLDASLIADLGEKFLLANLSVALTLPPKNAASHALLGANARPAAYVTWTPERPGDALIRELLPKIALSAALLVIGAFVVFFFSWRAATVASKAKSDFLAKISHELRTPLNPIMGFSEAMTCEIFGPLSETYKGYAGDILRSSKHLALLIDDILDVSRIEAGKMALQESVIDLEALVDDLPPLEQLLPEPTIGGTDPSKIRVHHTLDPALPKLRADEFRVRQVIVNMLMNAARHSQCNDIYIRSRLKDGGIQIAVEDRGKGIAADDLGKLFTPFTQLGDSHIRPRGAGSGLGLALSRELMALHGGELDLESRPGVGTSAIMTFPASRTVRR